MDLHTRLRTETRHLHQQLEHAPLLNKIMSNELALVDYVILMKKFYGFILPCEGAIQLHTHRHLIMDREKTHLLQADLLALGVDKSELTTIAHCSLLPPTTERLQLLGYLYVMEGSTLGGQMITQHIQQHLRLQPDNGGRYFYGYGKETSSMWKSFCKQLNEIDIPADQDIIVSSANTTFHSLYAWMCK
jgi:heme oxygenase